ncbi:MAG: hypothetical protein V8T00_04765 [Oscillospiraceae bacterium]
MEIGEGSEINCGINTFPEPYMVSIGKKVYIPGNAVFMTHDGALSWMSRAMGYTDKRTDKMGTITVKDNCFIGAKPSLCKTLQSEAMVLWVWVPL